MLATFTKLGILISSAPVREELYGSAALVFKFIKDKTGSANLNEFRRSRLANADRLLKVLNHGLVQANVRGPLAHRHIIDFFLQLEEGIEQVFRTRWTTHHIDIHGYNLIHALQNRVGIEGTAYAGAGAHGDAPLGVWHLFPDALDHRRHLQRHGSGHDHQVGLTWAGTKDLSAKTSHVKSRCRGSNHLNRAARQTKG